LKPPAVLSRWWPLLALLALTLIWGYSWVLVKQALAYASPFVFAAQRCVAGGLALLLIVKLMGYPLELPAPGSVLGISLMQGTGFMTFSTWALVEGGAGKTAVLAFTMPIWVLLIAWPVLGERVRGAQWIAAICTLAGLLLIIEPWNLHTSLLSKVLAVGAALCWAIGTVLVKRLRAQQPVNLLSLTAWMLLLGSAPLVLLAFVVPGQPTQWTATYIVLLTIVALVTTALGWWLWVMILDRVPAWEASLSVLGIPVVAIVSSRIAQGEEFRMVELGGILLIACGLALLSLLGWIASRRKALQ
jgi:drug/metabolite transporter (DMT)-like permease